MRRRTFLGSAFGAAAAPGARAAARRPNVIIVLTDDQGYGDLSCHGNPALKTPNLDRLYAESVRLTDYHVAPMCTPTRSQLMTGCDALRNCAMNVSSGRTLLRTDMPTMADVFAASGYSTGLFGKWHLGDSYPYRPQDRGFQESVWFPSSHIGSCSDYWNNDYYGDTYRRHGRLQRYEGYCTDVFFNEAMEWMGKRHAAGEPFFACIPTNTPHGPLFVPESYRQPYAKLPPALASFFGMIANIDENMGRLEKMLVETGMKENTILIFQSDNGGTAGVRFYNAGLRAGKVTLWDGGHRTPFFLRWPAGGIRHGRDIEELTEVQDLLPTLIDLCGLKRPAGADFDGVSLAGLLRGERERLEDRMLVVQFSRMNVGRPQWGDAAVLWRKWRLVSGTELYDVASDPAQARNVIREHPDVAARMRKHSDQWWREVEPRLDSFLPTHIGAEAEDPVLVSPTEWADSFLDQSTQVRAGVRRNGLWHLQVEHAGGYEFALSRWPRELGLPMRAPAPPHQGECGQYAAGAALPIARAELRIAGRAMESPVGPGDREAVFKIQLGEGRTTMQTFFYDEQGRELCGAYYVYARRLS